MDRACKIRFDLRCGVSIYPGALCFLLSQGVLRSSRPPAMQESSLVCATTTAAANAGLPWIRLLAPFYSPTLRCEWLVASVDQNSLKGDGASFEPPSETWEPLSREDKKKEPNKKGDDDEEVFVYFIVPVSLRIARLCCEFCCFCSQFLFYD